MRCSCRQPRTPAPGNIKPRGDEVATRCATPEAALEFVREHGVVLASAKGAAPRLTEAIAGGPIKGSWWSHPQGRHIYRVLEEGCASDEVLVCRLLDGKVTP